MRDHELVADRDEDDSRHDRQVQVGVDVAADLAPLLGSGRADLIQDPAGDLAEVQPPERRRGEEGEQERSDDLEAQPRIRGSGPCENDALSEHDDHEQLEALAEMGALDLPLAHGGNAHAREPIRHQRRREVKSEGTQPQNPAPRLGVDDAAGDPQRRGEHAPGQDLAEVLVEQPARRDHDNERVAPDLQTRVGAREQQRVLAEPLGDRHRHQQARAHHEDQHEPDRPGVRVEPVGHPRRVVPRPVQGDEHERRLGRARPADVGEQIVRQLGDSEDVDEVEEELEERRALLVLPTSADDRQVRDNRARSGRHAASIGGGRGWHAAPGATPDGRQPGGISANCGASSPIACQLAL